MHLRLWHGLGQKVTQQGVFDGGRAVIDHTDAVGGGSILVALHTLIDKPQLAARILGNRLNHDNLRCLLEPPPPTIDFTRASTLGPAELIQSIITSNKMVVMQYYGKTLMLNYSLFSS